MKARLFLMSLWICVGPGLLAQTNTVCDPDQKTLETSLNKKIKEADFWNTNDSLPIPEFSEKLIQSVLPPDCPSKPLQLASAFHYLGIGFSRKKNYEKSILAYHQAIELRSQHLEPNHPDIVKGYNNIGSNYYKWADRTDIEYLDLTAFYLRKSIELNLSREEPSSLLGTTYIHLGRYLRLFGDLDNANLYFNAAIDYLKQDVKQAKRLANVQNDLANLLAVHFSDGSSAKSHVLGALDYFQPKGPTSSSDSSLLGNWYQTLGNAYMQMDSLDAALEYCERALSFQRKPLNRAQILNNMAVVYNRQQRFSSAIPILKQAIDINEKKAHALAQNYDNLGDAYMGLGQSTEALAAFHQAIRYFTPAFRSTDPFDNPIIKNQYFSDPRGLLNCLAAKARILHGSYDLVQANTAYLGAAFQTYLSIDSLIQRIRLSYQAEGSKESWVALCKPVYEGAIKNCMALFLLDQDVYYKEQAFAYAEKSKAMVLLDAVRGTNAMQTALPLEVRDELKQIMLRKAFFEKQWDAQAENAAMKDSLIRYREMEQTLIEEIQQNFPQFYQLRYAVSPLSVEALREDILLSADQAFVEYFIGEQYHYVFLISKDRFDFKEIPASFPLGKQVEALRFAIESDSAMDQPDQFAPRLYHYAKSLFDQFLAPLGPLDQIPERLIIVRDDSLLFVPFEVLVSHEVDDPRDFAHFPYLVRQKSISYAYSASLLKTFIQNKIQPSRNFLAYAPVNFAKHQDQYAGIMDLPFSENEVEAIADSLDGQIRTFERAQLESFVEMAPEYRVLYLASHGLPDGILFHDSVLTSRDLYQMRFNAALVVLGACETGLGDLKQGEGIMSLTRGFAYTGAKSFFSTQWSVPNNSRFMRRFMMNLKNGMPKDKALQNAKLQDISNQYPNSWAAYEIQGDIHPIVFTKRPFFSHSYQRLALLSMGLLVLGFLFYRRRQKKEKHIS